MERDVVFLNIQERTARLKSLRQHLITLAKIVGSLAVLGILFYFSLSTPEKRQAFAAMLAKPKDWGLENWGWLLLGFLLLFTAVSITFVRWRYLVHALGVDLSLKDTLRISFLGYMFNFLPTGIAGGDLLKAWMLGREKPGNRAKALASVVVDRIVGLYVLFLVGVTGIIATGFWSNPDPWAHRICVGVLIVTAVSTIGITLVLIPGFLESKFVQAFTRLPKVGHAIESLLEAIIIYRSRRVVLFWSCVMTVPVHVLLTLSLFVLALGLGFRAVPMHEYFVIYPISGMAQTIPLNAGPAEAVIFFFYKAAWAQLGPAAAGLGDPEQQGLILAIVYRIVTLLITPIGAAYYFLGARSEVKDVMHEIEEEEEADSGVKELPKKPSPPIDAASPSGYK
jgi:uncharacterized protein (TIRG00374 family)